jgi:hypothetical protein
MRVSKKVPIALLVCVVFALSACGYFRNNACKQRGIALETRLERLRHDADEQLTIGTKRDTIVKFCKEHDLRLTFDAKGCAPFGCGTDDFSGGLRVDVDKDGTVIGKPFVSGIYTNCL